MGVLIDGPAPSRALGGEGKKFVDLYRAMDDDDRALIRKWDEDPLVATSEIHRRIHGAGIDVGRSSVERGLAQLRAAQWEC